MNPLISIIIPVYNVEKYLDKCIQSVLTQTYDNFEVILVDDGSTDNSGKLCDEYAKRDNRVTVYHKSNRGLSDARNFGVEHCNADIVSFIDSDDCVSEDYLEYLWFLMYKYSCKVSCANNVKVMEGKSFSLKKDKIIEVKLDTAKALERICYTSVGAVARLYRKELLIKNPFPVGRLYEDLATTYKIISECDYIAFSDKPIYIWIQRENSITHRGIDERQFDIFTNVENMSQYYKDYFPNCKKAASAICIMAVIRFLTIVFQYCDKKEEKKYFRIARDFALPHFKNTFTDKKVLLRIKIACVAIWLGYCPARSVCIVRNQIRRMWSHI